MNLKGITLVANRLMGNKALLLSKHSPKILLGIGIIAGVACVVEACRQTHLKLTPILKEHSDTLASIEQGVKTLGDKYSEADANADKLVTMKNTTIKIAKIYLPALGLGLLSVACLYGGYHVLNVRNIALTSAFKTLSTAHTALKKYVDDKAKQATEALEKPNEQSLVVAKTNINAIRDAANDSIYARCFDNTNPNWSTVDGYNMNWLYVQQVYANELLTARGHLFLNEVYSMLGMAHTPEGALVGWVKDSVQGDGYVDFDLGADRRFKDRMRGIDESIWMDFNVDDGTIYDAI